jgi:hypothetical protein
MLGVAPELEARMGGVLDEIRHRLVPASHQMSVFLQCFVSVSSVLRIDSALR